MKFPSDYIVHCEPAEKGTKVTMSGWEELIRCKECKHFDGYYCHNKWWGDGYGNYTPPIKSGDGFCDWADREDDETD